MLAVCLVCGGVKDYRNRELWRANSGIDANIEAETEGGVRYADEERTLYLEGCGFRRVARIMSKIYRYQTIINRIKKAGLKVLKESSTVRIDELHMYITRSEEHEFGR